MNASGEGRFCYQWKLCVIVFSCVFLLIPHYVSHASLTDGLVGHWTFDGKDTTWTSSTTGTTRDLSGNGNTGTLTNMNRATAPKTGKIGQGINFNGTNQYITTPDADIFTFSDGVNDRPFSLSAWVYYVSTGGNEPGASIVSKYNSYSPFRGEWEFFISSDDKFSFQTLGSGPGVRCFQISNSTIPKNTWVHVSAVYDGSGQDEGITLYVNGALTPSTGYGQDGTYTAMQNRASPVAIGAAAYSGSLTYSSFLNGKIDDVRIYNRALSASEITQLYKQGATKLGVTPSRANATSTGTVGLGAGLVGHWTFDGKDTTWTSATAGTVRDVSGRGKNGTLSNFRRVATPTSGKIGQGLIFNGTTQDVILPSSTVGNNDTTVTVSAWIKPSTISGEHVIFSPDLDYSWYVGQFGSSLAWRRGGVSFGVTNSLWSQSNVVINNKWQFVTFVGTPTSLSIYQNGSLVVSTSTDGMITGTTAETRIGSSGSRPFQGSLDDVRVYNRALSSSEITQLYKQGATKLGVSPSRSNATSTGTVGLGAGLVGHWTFDGKDTTWTSSTTGTTRDLSGNGNTGTLSAMNRATSPKRGKIGQAFMFSDASRVGTASYNILGTTAPSSFTVSSWFNVASTTLNHMYIIEYGGGAAFVVEKVPSEDTMRCKVRDPGAGFLYSNSVARPQIGQWHLFSCVYNASNKTLVFNVDDSNNTPVSISSFSSFDNPGQLFLGGRSYGTYNGFVGSLDDMRIYNRPLSATEVAKLYKLGQTRMR